MRRDGRVSFLFCFGIDVALSQCRAGHCVIRWTRGSVEPQAALRWTALAPLLARARALPLSAMAIMVTLMCAAASTTDFQEANMKMKLLKH